MPTQPYIDGIKTVFIVTHGEKHRGPNPMMTERGFMQVQQLRRHLPEERSHIVCGTGQRHFDVAKALGLEPTNFTAVVGGPESLEKIEGDEIIVLADGKWVSCGKYTTLPDTSPALRAFLTRLPANTVICAGKPALIMLGYKGVPKDAVVYEVRIGESGIINIAEYAVATDNV